MTVTILAFVFVLGIVITVHEIGHFVMAKLLKIRVLVFSLGFGPKLVGFTRGGTEYRISPLPLGGYVKMAGENYDPDRKGEPDEFLSHPKWHRFLVAVAGPFMNILLAVIIIAISYMQGMNIPRYPKEPAIVGPVAANSAAKRAGLETGDLIVSVNRNPIVTWEDLEIALGTAPKAPIDIEVERNGQMLQLRVEYPPDKQSEVDPATLGFKFTLPRAVVDSVDENSPAHKAGLKEGDEIISVQRNGKIGKDYNQILNIISESEGNPLMFTVRRPDRRLPAQASGEDAASGGGKILRLRITPVEDKGRVVVGFVPDIPSDLKKLGPAQAVVQSIRRNYEMSSLIFRIIGRIFKGSASARTLVGPIGIARISGNAARTGSARVFFGLVALISLNLGVLNLLPIPILDGGLIALLLIEGLIRRDLSLNLKEKIVQAGFVLVILLMGFVVLNDLSKIIDFNRLFR